MKQDLVKEKKSNRNYILLSEIATKILERSKE